MGLYCVDGETWKDGCADCQCVNGFPTCFWVGCGTFQVPEGIICNVRPGTENDCCPKYDCEEGKLFFKICSQLKTHLITLKNENH